ncbi:MAG: RNA polymerase sigma factor [Parcubacteria group bacterium]|jgi:RNA polymerase sigma-70 factor (ECF subfamily)
MISHENTQQSDEELVILTRNDPSFFGLLMERYEAKMLLYIKRISAVTTEEAEDVLQESFLKAYQNVNSFDEKLSFSSWLYRIVHNETISYWRKKKIRPHGNTIFVDDDFLERIADARDMVADVDKKHLKDVVQKVFDVMDEKYRDILILKYIEDKNYEEISDILKKPAGTVATHINRAKKQFKELYQKSNINV